jgi:Uma2 family endonuclease
MATVEKPVEQRTGEQRFVIHNVAWRDYETLLEAMGDRPAVQVTYDQGTVELMSPSNEHEYCERLISYLVLTLCDELDLPRLCAGSTTWRRKDLERGLEPDSCFYLANEHRVRGRKKIDLSVDPPPDLAIEVQYSRSIVDKVPIYAALGVPELWLYDMEELRVLRLDEHRHYAEQAFSEFFPAAAMEGVRQFIALRGAPHETAWAKDFRRWVRENLLK